MYLLAGSVALLGNTAFALRAVAALLGTLTVVATYLLGRRLFGPGVALVAAALLATSYWHVHISRLGLRAISLPLVLCLAGFFLWGGLRSGRWRDFLLAGAFLGLAGYTYFAARVYPLALLGLLLALLLFDRALLRRRAAQLAASFGVAALVVLPLAAWSFAHPELAGQRIGEASVFSQPDPVAALRAGVLSTLGMFLQRGDGAWRYNYEARPIFDPLVGALFVAGLLLGLGRIRRPEVAFVLAWLVVMALPSALATESPHAIRSAGMVPAVFLVPALAAVALPAAIAAGVRRAGRAVRRAGPGAELRVLLAPRRSGWAEGHPTAGVAALALALAAWQGAATVQTYFGAWADHPETYRVFHTSSALAVEALRAIPAGETVYLSEDSYEPAELVPAYLLAERGRPTASPPERLPFRVFDGLRELVLPPEPAGTVWYVFPSAARPPDDRLAALRAGAEARTGPIGPQGPAYLVLRTTPEGRAALQPACPLGVSFGAATLLGFDPARPTPAGGAAEVRLYWRVDQPPRERLAVFLHVLDDRGEGWGGRDEPGYFNPQRLVGETIVAAHRFPLVRGVPPGRYSLAVGLYRADGARLEPKGAPPGPGAPPDCAPGPAPGHPTATPVAVGTRPASPNAIAAGALEVLPGEPEALVAAGQRFGPLAALQAALDRTEAGPGEPLGATLLWQAADRLAAFELRPRLRGPDGQVAHEWPAVPVGGAYPSDRWAPGEVVRQRLRLPVPSTAEPGPRRVSVEVVADGRALGELDLGAVQVRAVERRFEPPPVSTPVGADFAGLAVLLGYDLEGAWTPGGRLRLTLYWQARAELPASYTVFTHLLDGANVIRGQHDGIPAGGARPTTGWAPGEVIVDVHELQLTPDAPPGPYLLEVGLYQPETGARLQVLDPGGAPRADHVVLTRAEVR